MKIYQNGQLLAAYRGTTGPSFDWQNFCTAAMTTQAGPTSNFSLGGVWGADSWTGTMDEFAIYDADISPNDVTANGTIIHGIPAVQFPADVSRWERIGEAVLGERKSEE